MQGLHSLGWGRHGEYVGDQYSGADRCRQRYLSICFQERTGV